MVYLITTKIEAFLGWGNNDFLSSPDLEFIISILDGRAEIISDGLQHKEFINALPGLITPVHTSPDRFSMIIGKIEIISTLQGI